MGCFGVSSTDVLFGTVVQSEDAEIRLSEGQRDELD